MGETTPCWLAANTSEPHGGTSINDLVGKTNMTPKRGDWTARAMKAMSAIPVGTRGPAGTFLDIIIPLVGSRPTNHKYASTGWLFSACIKAKLLQKTGDTVLVARKTFSKRKSGRVCNKTERVAEYIRC